MWDSGSYDPGSNPGRAILEGSEWLVASGNDNRPHPAQDSLWNLSQDKLKEIIKTVSKVRETKYKRRRIKKYGNLNKGFTDEELKRFFKFCENDKARLTFQLMAYLGLRVGEAVMIKLSDLDFNKNKVRIETEKANTIDYLYMHEKVRILLKDWVRMHENQIKECDNYLFFSNDTARKHISKDWLRKEFRITREKAGLSDSYGVAEDINNPNKWKIGERKLYRLSTHSLRHYFISKVYSDCKDPIKTQKLARHLDFKSTQNYIHIKQEEVDNALKEVFEQEKVPIDKSDLLALVELAKMLKGK